METKKLTTKEAWQLIANAFAGKLTPEQDELLEQLEESTDEEDFTAYGLCLCVDDLFYSDLISYLQRNAMHAQVKKHMDGQTGYIWPVRYGDPAHDPKVHDKLRAELAQKFADEA